MKRGRLTNQQVNVYRSYKRYFAQLPPPDDTYTREESFEREPMNRTAFEAALGCSLIHQIDNPPNAPAEFATDRKLWEALIEDGLIERDGSVPNPCGTTGPLDCGSRSFTNEGDVLRCKYCGETTKVSDAKGRLS